MYKRNRKIAKKYIMCVSNVIAKKVFKNLCTNNINIID